MDFSSSLSAPSLTKNEELRNWSELPQELTYLILLRLGKVDILLRAQKVCRSWRRVCKDPSMWQKIDMRGLQEGILYLDFVGMCRQAVDLSQGALLEINISDFGSNGLLSYIADRSPNLRSLGLKMCHSVKNKGLVKAISKLPLLETLEISAARFRLNLKAIGKACPQLQTLKLRYLGSSCIKYDDALAIVKGMPQLRHLQLTGSRLTETGLNVILDNLPHLKHLYLPICLHSNVARNLERRCLEWTIELKLPFQCHLYKFRLR